MKWIFGCLLLSVIFTVTKTFDFKLIFSLKEYFNSDVVLLARKEVNNDNVVRNFFKYKNDIPRAFLGAVDLNKNLKEFIPDSHRSRFQNIMIVSDCQEDFINKISDLQNCLPDITASLVIVIFTENKNIEIENLYIPFNYKFLLVQKKNFSNYEIFDVYQIGKNGSKIYSHFSFWDEDKKLKRRDDFYSKRMDLAGHVLNIQYLPPPTDEDEYWKLFSERLNFTINPIKVAYGGVYPNGSKTEIFRYLDDHILDGTYHNCIFSHDRAAFFDYIFPCRLSETKIYMAAHKKFNWTSFLAPFSIGVWMTIILWIFIASFILHLIKNDTSENSAFSVIQAFSYQGGKIASSKISFYIAYLMPYLLAVIIIQTYSCIILSYLTVDILTPPFKTLKDIVKDGRYKILLEMDTYPLFHFQTDQGEEATNFRNHGFLLPVNELVAWGDKRSGFQRICNNKYVFISDGGPTNDHAIMGDCTIVELDEVLFYDAEGIITWKGFPYKNVMTKIMRQIQRAGLKKLKQKNILPHTNQDNLKPISFEYVRPIFLLYTCLAILSLIILFGEKCLLK